jgi:hypothetical protein
MLLFGINERINSSIAFLDKGRVVSALQEERGSARQITRVFDRRGIPGHGRGVHSEGPAVRARTTCLHLS